MAEGSRPEAVPLVGRLVFVPVGWTPFDSGSTFEVVSCSGSRSRRRIEQMESSHQTDEAEFYFLLECKGGTNLTHKVNAFRTKNRPRPEEA